MTLLDAVDALTKPVREAPISQPLFRTRVGADGRPMLDDNGDVVRDVVGTQKITVEHPSLLQQLEDAIASTIGAGGGRGKTAAHLLNVLDSDALTRFVQIQSQIRDWCRKVDIRPDAHPSANLRAWYVARLSANHSEQNDAAFESVLRGWARQIEAKLNPPRTWEIIRPCPSCKSDVYSNEEGDTALHPVRIQYQPDSVNLLAEASASCKNCGREWVGLEQLRSLMWDVEQQRPDDEESDTPDRKEMLTAAGIVI